MARGLCGGLLHCCVLEGGRDVGWWDHSGGGVRGEGVGGLGVGFEAGVPDDPSHSQEVSGDPLSCTLPWPALVSSLPPGGLGGWWCLGGRLLLGVGFLYSSQKSPTILHPPHTHRLVALTHTPTHTHRLVVHTNTHDTYTPCSRGGLLQSLWHLGGSPTTIAPLFKLSLQPLQGYA